MSNFNVGHYTEIARVINLDRKTMPVANFKAKREAKFALAIALARMFMADNDEFNAEAFFKACGYSPGRIQQATNTVGQLTRADVNAAKVAIERPPVVAEVNDYE
jgi:hypothetical protein